MNAMDMWGIGSVTPIARLCWGPSLFGRLSLFGSLSKRPNLGAQFFKNLSNSWNGQKDAFEK